MVPVVVDVVDVPGLQAVVLGRVHTDAPVQGKVVKKSNFSQSSYLSVKEIDFVYEKIIDFRYIHEFNCQEIHVKPLRNNVKLHRLVA